MSSCGGCNTNPEVQEVEKKEIELPKDGKIVTLTKNAALKVKEFMDKETDKKQGMRLLVAPGGCAGYQYGMTFDDNKDGDIVVEEHGVKVFIDANSATHVTGTTIDFVDNLGESGFKIENPNAQQSCGCGKSFN